ncbi:DUF5590 domain-containing protein [Bacillus sp. FJAT-27445]|uniref:cell wall elongation regulator TseB-like domain-containing protein n=1 Tax=Bacillus sp. FJAT-27445 TaxID=1679166 RepID=UPI0007441D47|nr:DUF5590 domain-containing protein [Bacillus sp. FJAT-27445]
MKKIVLFSILFLALFTGIAGWIYSNATSPIRDAEQKAFRLAREETDLKNPTNFYLYNGNETVYVVEGVNDNGEKVIAWIPEKGKKAVIRNLEKGVSKNDAIRKVKNEKHPKEIISVRPGMEKEVPFWEVYYTTGNGLLNYYYVYFDSGEMYKLIENL